MLCAADKKAAASDASKRAPSAYNLFVKAKYAEAKDKLAGEGSETDLKHVSEELRGMWQVLSDSEKSLYEKESGAMKAQVQEAK